MIGYTSESALRAWTNSSSSDGHGHGSRSGSSANNTSISPGPIGTGGSSGSRQRAPVAQKLRFGADDFDMGSSASRVSSSIDPLVPGPRTTVLRLAPATNPYDLLRQHTVPPPIRRATVPEEGLGGKRTRRRRVVLVNSDVPITLVSMVLVNRSRAMRELMVMSHEVKKERQWQWR